MNREEVLAPIPIMEDEWDWAKQEFTGNKYQLDSEKYGYLFRCQACNREIFIDNYCSKCGQKLR